ncbi:MAG: ATP synthase F1 subunit gamma [Candidatus Kapabacteria bacterium]|jgi:F-type H+-transporting ATPase subunit gamma|nr:ATP synthase F1 subunit gamma [Candidatus Kapabacteria bacterium]
MATLRDIRQRITTVQNTSKITSAMKMVATAKLRRAQDAILSARPYATKLSEILSNLALAEEEFAHPFFQERKDVTSIAFLVITSDRGLCGSFNTTILRSAVAYIAELKEKYPTAKLSLVLVGKKSIAQLSKTEEFVQEQFPDVFGKLQFSTAYSIASLLSEGFLNYDYDLVTMIYSEFKSLIKQVPTIQQLLPIVPETTANTSNKKKKTVDYIYEPNREEILDTLLPKYLNMQVWKGLLESNAAEQAARMMAMDAATNNANDLIKILKLSYNKARQAAITTEMLEIVGGAEALKG